MNQIERFDAIYALMSASFPDSERRTYEGQRELLTNRYYRLITKYDDEGQLLGMLAAWEFPAFRFVEHIAVDPRTRGSGIGGQMMKDYMAQNKTPVLLEVEHPETEIAQRRIGFYERLGFHLLPFHYVQPPLQDGQPDLPLLVMSYPQPLAEVQFAPMKDAMYTEVYRVAATYPQVEDASR